MSRKILVVGHTSYNSPFHEYGEVTNAVNELLSCDLIVFTGGEDVSPDIYGEDPHPLTQNNPHRDIVETGLYEMAEANKIPMMGICRGAQFLCVMNGGKLHQHINEHCFNHPIYDVDSEVVIESATSSHHQEMIPDLRNSDVLALGLSNGIHTIEAVSWPVTNCLGVQFHPEWTEETSDEMKYFRSLVGNHIFKEENAYDYSEQCGC